MFQVPCRLALHMQISSTVLASLLLAASSGLSAQAQEPFQAFEIGDDGVGGLDDVLDAFAYFGTSITSLGDLDGDGNADLLVGAPSLPRLLALESGEMFVLFLEADATVREHARIAAGEGGFSGSLGRGDEFGHASARLGDLNGNGLEEIAVSAPAHDAGAGPTGALWILEFDASGLVVSEQEIGPFTGGFGGPLLDGDRFGSALVSIGDVDGDGTNDLAVGAEGDADLDLSGGAVWILFLTQDGSVKATQKISSAQGGLPITLERFDLFGSGLGAPGDLDGDGVPELLVGAVGDDDAEDSAGAVYVLFLRADGTPHTVSKITAGQGGFSGPLDRSANFGSAIANLGDLDGDGLPDLLVSAPDHDNGALNGGSLWFLSLQADGTVFGETLLNGSDPVFGGQVGAGVDLGRGLALVPDGLYPRLALGAPSTDSFANDDSGALWLLQLCDGDPTPDFQVVSDPIGPAPYAVTFQNDSTGAGATAWLWDFGDGTTSSAEHPTHVYSESGSYSVVLRASSAEGACALVQRDLISVVTPASVVARNGSGVNPDILTAGTAPVLGAVWAPEVDGSSLGAAGFSFLFVYADPLGGLATSFGELLVDTTSPRLALDTSLFVGGTAVHAVAVPDDLALVDLTASSQSYLLGSGVLTNALDTVLGL